MRTVKMLKRFGPSRLYVRYRYDEDSREHLKTVELIVRRRFRESETECPGSRKTSGSRRTAGGRTSGARTAGARTAGGRRLALRVGWQEKDLQRRVKAAGGQGVPDRRVWLLRREAVERLDLMARVVGGGGWMEKPGGELATGSRHEVPGFRHLGIRGA